ncbi:MAG: class I SAM-dependent methyltransferase [Candidatus Bathyarchaeota archaeon]|nr:class I SAM-dependent methyltransferase [Candidatus Bathyarchaeota archaeon]
MAHAPILDNFILKLLQGNLDNLDIIDIASGNGLWGFYIRTRANGLPNIIGLDIWPPYIKRIYRLNIYNSMICADVRRMPFKENSFDIVLACEVLEHIPKSEGKNVLYELERLARRMIIVTTPLGFIYQGEIDGNIYERHISAWTAEEFEERGYSVSIIDARPLPRTLKFIDNIRRFILRLNSPTLKEIIATKKYED